MAYAHAQKNCGISGITIMIAKNNLFQNNKGTSKSYHPASILP
jgi:phosphoserine aminotransferase